MEGDVKIVSYEYWLNPENSKPKNNKNDIKRVRLDPKIYISHQMHLLEKTQTEVYMQFKQDYPDLKTGQRAFETCSITGVGERLHKVLGHIGSKLNYCFHGNRKRTLTYNVESDVSIVSVCLFFYQIFFLNLQLTETGINLGRVQISARSNHSLRR